tara:strand:- start:907 stop:1188 length:282 start_codon:yes stop_codon:yes gene_type:complete
MTIQELDIPEIISVQDAAKRLFGDSSVGKHRVYKMIERGDLIADRTDKRRGKWWVVRRSIDDYLERLYAAAPKPTNDAQNVYALWPRSRSKEI